MNNEIVLGFSLSVKIMVVCIPPILGALIGWFIPTIAEWAIKVPFIPLEGLLEWVAALESQWISVAAAIIGVIAGMFFVFYVFSETLKITITDEEVRLDVKEKENTIQKKEISAIFMDGKDLVFLNMEGNELFRGHPESKKESVSEAFSRHRYPWKEKDPYEQQYERWVADHPEFPPHINALLSARENAIKNDETEEAQVLRKDLVNHKVVIHDEDKRQYVRMVRGGEK